MSSHYDIEMTTDDTLELDTIIKESSSAVSPISGVKHIGDDSDHKSELKGIQTSTAIFDPPKSGTYEIYINGQTLSINVTDTSAIPDTLVDNYEDSSAGVYKTGDDISTYYRGSPGEWTRTTGNIEGSKILTGESTLDNEAIFSNPGDGLNAYPDPANDDTVVYIFREVDGVQQALFNVGTGSDPGGYGLSIRSNNSPNPTIRIDRFNSLDGDVFSDFSLLKEVDVSTLTSPDWYWIEASPIENDNDTISVTLYDVNTSTDLPTRGSSIGTITATDGNSTTYAGNRGIGVGGDDRGNPPQADWIHID